MQSEIVQSYTKQQFAFRVPTTPYLDVFTIKYLTWIGTICGVIIIYIQYELEFYWIKNCLNEALLYMTYNAHHQQDCRRFNVFVEVIDEILAKVVSTIIYIYIF